MTGVVAFLMCIQAKHAAFVCAGDLYWGMRDLCRAGRLEAGGAVAGAGLLFGYAMKNSGLWLASRREKRKTSRR
jgi:hypothetical protein